MIYEKLPADIANRHVLLMDPILSTGNSAATAVEVRDGADGTEMGGWLGGRFDLAWLALVFPVLIVVA